MKIDFAQEFRNDLKEFREMTRKYHNKEISMKEYKHFSGGYGSYGERGGQSNMLRLRLPGGCIPVDKLGFIVESIDKYNISLVHLTTCQTIQLHQLSSDVVSSLIEEAWDHGIITRGGGGDYPRNVIASPLSGVSPDETFDVLPYVEMASDYLLSFINKVQLPRKLKVVFSNDPHNITHPAFRDLAFVAKENHTFDVYSAGGIGNKSKMGVLTATDVEPSKVLYYINAMIKTFTTYGNYEDRSKARTRFMQDSLGVDGYKEAFHKKLEETLATEDLDIFVTSREITKTGEGSIEDPRVSPQKQQGLYSVFYHPIGGTIVPQKLKEIYEAIKSMKEVELRLTPLQEMYIINLTASEAKTILAITEDGSKTSFESSTACIGAQVCQVGLRNSQETLKTLVDLTRPYNFKEGVLPHIHISGCPSSCSAHQISTIGFRGGVKKTEQGIQPAYVVTLFGSPLKGQERLAEEVGTMEASKIPDFFIELGKTIEKDNTTFDEWIKENHETFLNIVNQYL